MIGACGTSWHADRSWGPAGLDRGLWPDRRNTGWAATRSGAGGFQIELGGCGTGWVQIDRGPGSDGWHTDL